MFSGESNSYFNFDLDQASTDSTQVHFVALRSDEPASKTKIQQITEQKESVSHPAVKPTDSFGSNLVWLLPLWGAIVWLLLLCTASETWKLLRSNANTAKQGQRVPCKNCRFFSSNFYLKCAVRPGDALTDRAVDCTDFCQKSLTEEPKPQSKHRIGQ
jgi:hypothetical protein